MGKLLIDRNREEPDTLHTRVGAKWHAWYEDLVKKTKLKADEKKEAARQKRAKHAKYVREARKREENNPKTRKPADLELCPQDDVQLVGGVIEQSAQSKSVSVGSSPRRPSEREYGGIPDEVVAKYKREILEGNDNLFFYWRNPSFYVMYYHDEYRLSTNVIDIPLTVPMVFFPNPFRDKSIAEADKPYSVTLPPDRYAELKKEAYRLSGIERAARKASGKCRGRSLCSSPYIGFNPYTKEGVAYGSRESCALNIGVSKTQLWRAANKAEQRDNEFSPFVIPKFRFIFQRV